MIKVVIYRRVMLLNADATIAKELAVANRPHQLLELVIHEVAFKGIDYLIGDVVV